ncbi:MAG: hypothetical protein ACRDRD_09405, partial [Pseudonocardiaceae bacterium]
MANARASSRRPAPRRASCTALAAPGAACSTLAGGRQRERLYQVGQAGDEMLRDAWGDGPAQRCRRHLLRPDRRRRRTFPEQRYP